MVARCAGDGAFGPVLVSDNNHAGQCYSFDFTLLFEESIFSIAPCALALPIFALRVLQLRKEHVPWMVSPQRIWRSVTYIAIASIQLALVALWGTGRGVLTRTTLASAILAFLSTLAVLVLSNYNLYRSIRPSATVQAFLLATILLDLPRVRTQWLLDDNTLVARLFTVTFALRVVAVVLESFNAYRDDAIPQQKRRELGLDPESNTVPPEMRQGIIGLTFFSWLNPLFWKGYRKNLTMDDLYAIDPKLEGDVLHARLLKSWNSGMTSSLIKTLYRD
ncbi:hypothetical protein B0T17DRAFT_377631 [Bombardia bombarda]|uniref:Uncharacterized protein n=1 Tax=Bombardia bombarda TaxID=252184 RepID=A0AA40BVG9_9PEZI|nr:hypothetical protein B0T17DRAFT_377631 [Bombardia bombarda]